MALKDDVEQLGKNQAALNKNVLYLKKQLTQLSARVGALEGAPQPSAPQEDTEPSQLGAEQPITARAPSEARREVSASSSGKETTKHWENVGFKAFGWVGFLLILLGLFYLYAYAREQGWLGPMGEIILGVCLSVGVLIGAELLRRRNYVRFSQLMTGGGLGLLYFTFFATYFFERYREALGMSLGVNAILLTTVIIVAVLLSLRHDSRLLAIFAFLLGYLSAILIYVDGGAGMVHAMMLYSLILSVGMAIILWIKNWPMAWLPLAGSYIIYAIFFIGEELSWRYGIDTHPLAPTALAYLAAFFLLFNALSLLLKDDELHIQHIVVSAINAGLAFLFSILLVYAYWDSWRGVVTILFAAFYLAMAAAAKRLELRNLFEALFVIAVAFLTMAVPIQADGYVVAIAWAIGGALLFSAGMRLPHLGLRVLGYALMLLSILDLFVVWFDGQYPQRALASLVVLAAMVSIGYSLAKRRPSESGAMLPIISLAGMFLLTLAILVEMIDRRGLLEGLSSDARGVILTLVWAIEAIALIIAGFRLRSGFARGFGIALFLVTVAKILIIDLDELESIYRVVVTILVGLIALVASFVYVKNKERIKALLEEGSDAGPDD